MSMYKYGKKFYKRALQIIQREYNVQSLKLYQYKFDESSMRYSSYFCFTSQGVDLQKSNFCS